MGAYEKINEGCDAQGNAEGALPEKKTDQL